MVVLDQAMPGLSGTQTAALIRKRHPEVGIILFSAYLSPAVAEEVRAVWTSGG
ncbi:MAG: hypothetical protein ACYCS2_01515 [Acidimicrobiales bacterium]